MTATQLNGTTALSSISAIPSQGYCDRSTARKAMKKFAEKNKLSIEDFDVTEKNGKHHFERKSATERGITSPAPKKVDSAAADAIATFEAGIPPAFKISQEERKAGWDKQPPRTSARTSIAKSAEQTQREEDLKKQISAAAKKPAKVAKPAKTPKTKRERYDWEAATAKAKTGVLPAAPDMSAPTHKYFKPKLDEVLKLARAGDLKGLQSYKVSDRDNGSPMLVKLYQKVAIVAVKAKAAA